MSAYGGQRFMTYEQIVEVGGGMQDLIILAGQMGVALQEGSSAGGQAFQGLLVSAQTMSDGSVISFTRMGEQVSATVTNTAGEVIAQYGTITAGVDDTNIAVAASTETMAASVINSATNMGTSILTITTDAAGGTIATMTDMSGNVTSQFATMANGAIIDTSNMSSGVLSSAVQMHDGIITTVVDLAGNAISTFTDMNGNVTNQYTTMASESGSAITGLASQTSSSYGEMVSSAGNIPSSTEAVNEAFSSIEPPDSSSVVKAYGDMTKAAKKTAEAAEEARESIRDIRDADKGGSRSDDDDDDDDNPFAKRATGGAVNSGMGYLINEQRQEIFVPGRDGYILPNMDMLTNRSGGNAREIARELIASLPRGGDTFQFSGYTSEELMGTIERVLWKRDNETVRRR
jgi:hypothetical protein